MDGLGASHYVSSLNTLSFLKTFDSRDGSGFTCRMVLWHQNDYTLKCIVRVKNPYAPPLIFIVVWPEAASRFLSLPACCSCRVSRPWCPGRRRRY